MKHHHHTEHGLTLYHDHEDHERRGQVRTDKMPVEPVHDHADDPPCTDDH